jgi:predicted dehydrogenase
MRPAAACLTQAVEGAGDNLRMTDSQIIKGAVVGAGYFAKFHYEAWSRIPEVRIVSACDLIESKARAMQAQFGLPEHYSD